MKNASFLHRHACPAAMALLLLPGLFVAGPSARAAARTWGNTGTDFNTGASWGGTAPGSNDVGLFASVESVQPNLSLSLTIAGLRLSNGATGYHLTNTVGAELTLNGTNVTGSGGTTTSSAAAIRNDNASGTTTIDVPLILAPATGTISTLFQEANDGSTLILNGSIGETGTITLSLKNGTFQLNGDNDYSGGTSIDAAGTTVVIGHDNALGTGTVTIGNTSTFQAGGGARSISNHVTLGANTTIGGSNDLTFDPIGSVTAAGAATRTLTVNNAGLTTLEGDVFLSDSATTARTLRIDGTGAVTIEGVIADFDGVGLAGGLTYGGTNTLTLTGTNTYGGATLVTNGKLIVSGAITGSTVTVTPGTAVTATLAGSGLGHSIEPTVLTGSAVTIGSATLGSSSRLAPGDVGTVGTINFTLLGTAKMTFAANSRLDFDIDSILADSVVFSAAPLAGEWLAGAGVATLQLSGTIDYDETYVVFENAIADSTTGTFTFASIAGYDGVNHTASFAQSGNDYVLSFTSIPEPAAVLSLIVGAGLLVSRRRHS